MTAAGFRRILFAAVAALALASCSQDALREDVPQGLYTFTIGDAGTRSVLAEDAKGKFGQWESGDRLGTAVDNSSPGYSNITPGSPSTFRIYRSGGLQAGMVVYSYYPYNSSTQSISAARMAIPTEQSQSGTVFDFDAMPMAGIPFVVTDQYNSTTSTTSVGEIHLLNLASLVEFQVFSANQEYAGETITSVRFAADGPLAGSFTKDLTAVSADDPGTFAISGYSETSVTTKVTGGSAGSSLESAFSVFMVVAPGTYSGTVTVVTDVAEYSYTLSEARTFNRSVNHRLIVDLSRGVRVTDTPAPSLPGYFGCIEVPALELLDFTSGNEVVGSTKWYASMVGGGNFKVATHTYSYGGKVYRNFTSCMDGDRHCALWTAQPMHGGAYPDNNAGRGKFSDSKSYDSAFPGEWQTDGYGSSSYSRGHLCASNDRQTNDDQNQQTFYYTNQAPQWQNSFNGGIWSELEGAVQSKALSLTGRDTLYVVSGTLFEGTAKTITAKNGVVSALPSHFYKLLMLCSFNASGEITAAQGAAYVYTNEAHSGVKYYNDAFKTTIDAIETRAGFNFFPGVPDNLQDAAESGFDNIL